MFSWEAASAGYWQDSQQVAGHPETDKFSISGKYFIALPQLTDMHRHFDKVQLLIILFWGFF